MPNVPRAYEQRLVGVVMQPMPLQPWEPGWSSPRSGCANGVFSIERISRWKPTSLSCDDHARTPRPQMRVVVHAEKHVQHHITDVMRPPKHAAFSFAARLAFACCANKDIISICSPGARLGRGGRAIRGFCTSGRTSGVHEVVADAGSFPGTRR